MSSMGRDDTMMPLLSPLDNGYQSDPLPDVYSMNGAGTPSSTPSARLNGRNGRRGKWFATKKKPDNHRPPPSSRSSQVGTYTPPPSPTSSVASAKVRVVRLSTAKGKDRKEGSPVQTRKPFVPRKKDYLYTKMKYYSSLRKLGTENQPGSSPGGGGGDGWLAPPASVMPSSLFGLRDDLKPDHYQSSLATIASIVNTMMGTTVVSLPFGFSKTGLVLGLLVMFMVGGVACFTTHLLVRYQNNLEEFSAIVRFHLGRRVQMLAWVTSVLIIIGGAVVYHILMQQSLYSTVIAIADHVGGKHSAVSEHMSHTVAAAVILLLYPVCSLKNLQFLVKFNSVGFVFVWYTVTFIIVNGIKALIHHDVHLVDSIPTGESVLDPKHNTIRVVLWGEVSFGPLAGMLSLSFFIHNCIQPIIRHGDPATKHRDINLAFATTGMLYALVGVLGYMGLGYAHKLSSNFLDIFPNDLSDLYPFTARLGLLLQLLTVYPLLLLIIRTQVLGLIFNNTWPGLMHVLLLNGIVMGSTFACAAMNVEVGTVLRYTGAVGGLIVVFLVPLAMDVSVRLSNSTLSPFAIARNSILALVGLVVCIVQFIPKFL